ncbi:hypothetical protein ABFT23_05115 [Nocardioides sp. C4-1]|uniref:hypothetical protein n=1 Tax=Nocardioides sp. C4-1 TaxID=3151851 RepID=UPI00326391C2
MRLARTTTTLTTAAFVLSLAACGGDDASGAPEDASREDFCETFLDEPDGFGSDDPDEAVDAAHDYADRLREVGTPDVDADAREGFEIYVDLLAGLDADGAEDLAGKEPSEVFSDDELEKFEAFSEVTADCGPGEF